MRRHHLFIILVIILISAVVGYFVVSENDDSETEDQAQSALQEEPEFVDMSPIVADLDTVIKRVIERQTLPNVIVLDVRTDEEWNEEHAKGAQHWGLVEHLEEGEMPSLGREAEIYVYCRSGNRSAQAIRIMQEAGYTNLTNIGGLRDWKAAGGETTEGIDGDIQPVQ